MITFVTQVLETIHVAELRKHEDNVIIGFGKIWTRVQQKEQPQRATNVFHAKTADFIVQERVKMTILGAFITGNRNF